MKRVVKLCFIKNTFFSNNPANGVLRKTPFRQSCLEVVRKVSPCEFDRILKWSLVESKNIGSYWRYEPDVELLNELFSGSGRWLASDGGGQFSSLLDLFVRSWNDSIEFISNLTWKERNELTKVIISEYSKLYLCAGGDIEQLYKIILNNPYSEVQLEKAVLNQIEKCWENEETKSEEIKSSEGNSKIVEIK